MTNLKEMADVDDLLEGVEDIDISAHENFTDDPAKSDADSDWNQFTEGLKNMRSQEQRKKRVICKLDIDIANTLDECRVDKASRSDMVNVIVKSFIMSHKKEFESYRQIKETLI